MGKDISDESSVKQKLTTAFQKYAGAMPENGNEDALADRQAFRQAYQEIGKGRGFVRIHRIRDFLKWEPERFDRVLKSLMSGYAVEVHMGAPSILTEKEIQDSFTDETGTLYLTLTFWKEPA